MPIIPIADRYGHHLLWLRGRPLCLGCTCYFTGIVIGLPVGLFSFWNNWGFFHWAVLHLVLLLPTVIQPWTQLKSFKMAARTLLGFTTATYLTTGFLWIRPSALPDFFPIFVVIAFAAVLKSLLWLRASRIDNPCTDCPLDEFPTCDWNMPRLLEGISGGGSYTRWKPSTR